jgi:purine-binding chemotaxis protein CheW
MSKIDSIAEHEQALSSYLNDMLSEEPIESSHDNQPDLTNIDTTDNTWRKSDFQALFIEIQGLQLALPTHQITHILPWPQTELKTTKHKPNWYVGQTHQLHIVDTSQIILPSNYHDKQLLSSFIIGLNGGKWAISCTKINNVTMLSPEEVTWRQQAGGRPWLAGTILDRKSGILNIDGLIEQLELESANL